MLNRKTIIINAATVKIAGGLIVTIDLIKLLLNKSDYNLILIAPSIKKFKKLPASIHRIYSPELLLKPYFRWILDFIWLPGKINSFEADAVLTMGNLPARTAINQFMFNDNAFVSEKDLSAIALDLKDLLKHRLRRYLFWKRLRFVDTLIVQTQTELNRMRASGKEIPHSIVLSPLLPSHLTESKQAEILLPVKPNNTIRLVCLSYYWQHKNIGILKDVLLLAEQANITIQLVFTLNEKKIRGGKKFIQQLKPFIEKGSAINVGNIPTTKIKSLITQCDGMILPSLIETFGLNSLEAWYCNKLFFVANRPYAQEVGRNAAILFDPFDAEDILRKINSTFEDQGLMESLQEQGAKTIRTWNSSKDYFDILSKQIDK